MQEFTIALAQQNEADLIRYLSEAPSLATTCLPGNQLKWQPLHFVASLGHAEIAELLIKQGIAIDIVDEEGWQASHLAAYFGHLDVLKTLLKHGALLHAQNERHENLSVLAISGHSNRVLRYLLSWDIDVTAVTAYGDDTVTLAIKKGYLDCIIAIFSMKRYRERFSQDKLFHLFTLALQQDYIDIADYFASLIELNPLQQLGIPAKLKEQAKNYLTVFQIINVENFQPSRVESHWEQVKDSSILRWVLLRLLLTKSKQHGMQEKIQNVIQHLIEIEGATVFWTTLFNRYAANTLVTLLENAPQIFPSTSVHEESSPLYLAILHDRVEWLMAFMAHTLLDLKTIRFDHGYSILHLAARHNSVDCFHYLIQQSRLWPTSSGMDVLGDSVLHTAVRHEHFQIVEQLIKKYQVPVDPLNHEKQSPLDLALGAHNPSIIRLLIAAGATSQQPATMPQLTQSLPQLAERVEHWQQKTNAEPATKDPKIHTLVFQGGGVKGGAFYGALDELVKAQIIDISELDNVGGASAGAISALVLALGYTLPEVKLISENLDFYQLIDEHLRKEFFAIKKALTSQEGIKAFLGQHIYDLVQQVLQMIRAGEMDFGKFKPLIISFISAKKFVVELHNICQRLGLHRNEFTEIEEEFQQLRAKLTPFLTEIQQKRGIFSGESLRLKFVEWIVNQGFSPHLTFAELHAAARTDKRFKDLYVVSYCAETRQTILFSHETTPDAIIADAVRASMSIQLFFASHGYYVNQAGARTHLKERGTFYDGGSLDNYILHFFDKMRYLLNKTDFSGYSHHKITNPHVLGLRLVSSIWFEHYEHGAPIPRHEINGTMDFLFSILRSLFSMTKQESDFILNPDVQERTLLIDTHDIGTIDFDMTTAMKAALTEYGRQGARVFISRYQALRLRQQSQQGPAQRLNSPLQTDFQQILTLAKRTKDPRALEKHLGPLKNIAMIRDPKGNTLLHHAVMSGDVELLRRLYTLFKSFDYDNQDNFTPIDAIIYCRDLLTREQIVNFFEETNDWCSRLLKNAPRTFLFNWERKTYLLMQALRHQAKQVNTALPHEEKQQEILKRLLSTHQTLIPSRYSKKQLFSITYTCVVKSRFDLLKQHQLSLDGKDPDGWTVMHHLVKQNEKELLRQCFSASCYGHHITQANQSLLDVALQIQTFSAEDSILQKRSMIAFLLRQGVYRCQINHRDLIIQQMAQFHVIDPALMVAIENFKNFDQASDFEQEHANFLATLVTEIPPEETSITPTALSKSSSTDEEVFIDERSPVSELPEAQNILNNAYSASSCEVVPVLDAPIEAPLTTQALLSFLNKPKVIPQEEVKEPLTEATIATAPARGFLADVVSFNKATLKQANPVSKEKTTKSSDLVSFLADSLAWRRIGLRADEDDNKYHVHVYDARKKEDWEDEDAAEPSTPSFKN